MPTPTPVFTLLFSKRPNAAKWLKYIKTVLMAFAVMASPCKISRYATGSGLNCFPFCPFKGENLGQTNK